MKQFARFVYSFFTCFTCFSAAMEHKRSTSKSDPIASSPVNYFDWSSSPNERSFLGSVTRKLGKLFSPEIQKEVLGIVDGKEREQTIQIIKEVDASILAQTPLTQILEQQINDRISLANSHALQYLQKLQLFNRTPKERLKYADYIEYHQAIKEAEELWFVDQALLASFLCDSFQLELTEAQTKMFNLIFIENQCKPLYLLISKNDSQNLGCSGKQQVIDEEKKWNTISFETAFLPVKKVEKPKSD